MSWISESTKATSMETALEVKSGLPTGDLWIKKFLIKKNRLWESLKSANPGDTELIRKVAMAAREIKGEAGTFNFPLLTRFGDGLFNFTDSMTELSPKRIAVIQAHVDAMTAVLAHNMRGDGGPVGSQLVRGLDMAIEKFKQE